MRPSTRTALLVDRDQKGRDQLRAVLKKHAFVVLEAPDPVSALTLLLWSQVSVIILNLRSEDLQRPRPSAFDLLQSLRRDESLAKVPVLSFSNTPPADLLAQVDALTH